MISLTTDGHSEDLSAGDENIAFIKEHIPQSIHLLER